MFPGLLSRFSLCCCCIVFTLTVQAQLRSFPGAEGAGAFTSGGRGTLASPTTVFEVTNLTDVNSPGSLRYALSAVATYRTIVFRVSGTIHLTSRLTVKANTTIAGQTAPGDGICIADYPVVISGDNVIIRYMRFRMGDKNQLLTSPANCGVPVAPFNSTCMPLDGSGGDDALGNLGNKNIIIDHCSVSWSSDEALTVYRGDSVTLQWNFITEPLNYSYHFETGDTDFEYHGFGGIWGARRGSFHHNLIAHCKSRMPRFAGNSTYGGGVESADFRNNVIYNWGLYSVYGGEGGQYNLVNNYFKYGPSTPSNTMHRIVNVDSSTTYPYASYYLSGNYVDGSTANTLNNWSGAYMASGNAADTVKSKVSTPYLTAYLPSFTDAAIAAYDSVLNKAGAIIPRRDTLDERIVNDVRLRKGKLIDVQGGFPHGTPYAQTVNAWPALNSTVAPADTDHDGMPDTWEAANGLNSNDAADRQYTAVNGYTNLENYLNSITAATTGSGGSPVAVSATWPLLTDQSAAVTNAAITATNQTLGSYFTGIQYGSSFGGVSGWQRVATTSYLPIGYDQNAYVQYAVAPATGKNFTATSFEMSCLGGGTGTAKVALYYSLDGFVTSQPLGTCTYNGSSVDGTINGTPVSLLNTSTASLTGQQILTVPLNILVVAGKTLTIRAYVWITGTGNRYFPSQNVKLDGTVTDQALPLQLMQFTGSRNNGRNTITWHTVNEQKVAHFTLYRSNDGRSFNAIHQQAAMNTPSADYRFTDEASARRCYYYLRSTDASGVVQQSHVIVVGEDASSVFGLYPNPAKHIVTITHPPATMGTVAELVGVDGTILQQQTLQAAAVNTQLWLDKVNPGVYQLRLRNKYDILYTCKLVRL